MTKDDAPLRKINIDDLNALANDIPQMLGYLTDNSCGDPDCCGGPFYTTEDFDQGVATLARFGLVYDGKA
jgi:hypothetical protein